ncbi:PLxRFG domain-containing protein [Photobacterium damselae]|uniref:PLxRFG domain-containing protein n=1 Tax=Photobacterium damselae TaxID=38293 RepID=UPI001F38B139|nr:PLxRFG domain-containing protein [Photobacterium damselae]UKA12667.1 PLxRFG domain-containing protein [Photobacterium damselae subsp. damselae]
MENPLLGKGIGSKSTITAQTDTSSSSRHNGPALDSVIARYNQLQSGDYELTDDGIKPKDLDVTVGDTIKAVGIGALDLVSGVGEASERIFGVGKGLRDLSNSASESLKDSMTQDGQFAMQRSLITEDENGSLKVGDGFGDADVWAIKIFNAIGTWAPGIVAGGGAGFAAKGALGTLARTTMLKRGASEIVANQVAKKVVEYAGKAAATSTLTTGSVGSAALGAKEQLKSLGPGWLSQNSTSYQTIMRQITSDPKTAELSAIEKENLAIEHLANDVSQQVSTDPKVWMASVAGTMGDMVLFKAMGRPVTNSIIKGGLRSATTEGATEAIEEGVQAYSSNQALNNQAQVGIDPMQGVTARAVEGGILGAAVGGPIGVTGSGVSKLKERSVRKQSTNDDEPKTSEVDVSSTINAGPIVPDINPADFGLSDEQAQMILNPDPDLLHVGLPPKGTKLSREEQEKVNARRNYQNEYNNLINTDQAKAFAKAYKDGIQKAQTPQESSPLSDDNIDVSATINAGTINHGQDALNQGLQSQNDQKPQYNAPPSSPQTAPKPADFGLSDAEAQVLHNFSLQERESLVLDGQSITKANREQYLKAMAKRVKDNPALFKLLKSEGAKAYLKQYKAYSDDNVEKAKIRGLVEPDPVDFGLTQEQAEMIVDPDPTLMEMKLSKKETPSAELLKEQQKADNYKRAVNALLKSDNGKAYLDAEADFRVKLGRRNRTLREIDNASRQADLKQQQPIKVQRTRSKEDNNYLDELTQHRFGRDYQPTKAAIGLREALGLNEQELINRDRGIAPLQDVKPAQPSIDAVREHLFTTRKREEQKEKLKRTGSSQFTSRSNRMKLLEEGKKPIRYFDYGRKTKRLQKKLQRLHIPRKTSDEILQEFRNHEKRLEAFRSEEARKPENQVRRQHAKSLFEPTTTTLFKTFEQNSLTQALALVSAIAQRDGFDTKIQESIRASIAESATDDTSKGIDDQAIIDSAVSVIQNEVQSGNARLKGIRQKYRNEGLTAKQVNQAVINKGLAKKLVEFEKQTAKTIKDRLYAASSTEAQPIPTNQEAASSTKPVPKSATPSEQKIEREHDDGEVSLTEDTVEQENPNLSENKPEHKSISVKENDTKALLNKNKSEQLPSPPSYLTKKDIQDVGEKIGGARKDIWEAYSSTIEGKTQEELQSLPFSKSWPQPNYQAMLNQGSPLENLSLFRAIRESIPSKPRASYKVSRWAQNVRTLREVALRLLDGSITQAQTQAILNTSPSRDIHKVAGRAALYQSMGHEHSLAAFTVSNGEYSLFNGQHFNPPKNIWTVERTTKINGLNHWPRMMAFGDTQTEAITKFKSKYQELNERVNDEPKLASFDIYTKHSVRGYFIGKKVGRVYVDLEGPIDTIKKAREILNEDNERLSQKLAREKYIPTLRTDENHPRVGEDIRQGRDVSADDFAKAFGFRGVEFGNWVDQKKRQAMVNEAYDALMDMAAVLNLSPKAISLNGELGLAFGARGIGGKNAAKAHYEPGKMVINLTKKQGAGSLGHEWWHALDNYFGKMDTSNHDIGSDAMMTSLSLKTRQAMMVRAEMRAAYKDVMESINNSNLVKRSSQLDKKRTKDYWSTPEEMSARSFESYLIAKLADQNVRNDFLANIVSEQAWNKDAKENGSLINSYPYPNQSESESIRRVYDHLFKTIDEHEFADGRVMLFSQEAFSQGSDPEFKGMPLKQAKLAAQSWLRQYKGGAAVSIKVVQTQAEAEQILGTKFDGYKINAFYDEKSSSVVVVADNIANTKELREKLRHEILVHHGLRAVVGDTEYGQILKRIYSGLTSKYLKPLIDDIEKSYNRDEINGFVEEVLAHVAETERNTVQQWYDRIVSAIAQALRKVGIISPSDMTKAELRNIVQTLSDRIKALNTWGTGTDSVSYIGHLHRTKFSQKAAFNKPMPVQTLQEVLSKANENMFDTIKDNLNGFGIDKLRSHKYALLTLDQLAEIGKKYLPPIARYEQSVREMETTQNLLIEDVANLIEDIRKWAQQSPQTADTLFNVMHKATLASVDPSKPFDSLAQLLQEEVNRIDRRARSTNKLTSEQAKRKEELLQAIKNEPVRRQEHAKLRDQFGKLPADAKAHFENVKNHYRTQRGRMVDALEARIKRAQMDKSIKKEMLRSIRFDHERAEKELYFPLSRFGEYWIDTADENGERVFLMFETQTEMERKKKALIKAGFKVNFGTKLYETQKLDGASLGFISDLIRSIEDIDGLNEDYKESIGDMIYQLYLNTMPDRSIRRAYIHRKGVAGYSNDAIRAMADQGFKQSRQQARLDHLDDLELSLKTMKEMTQKSNQVESNRIYSEVAKRHEWVLNPARSPIAQKLTSLGFVWMLGLSPASAITNLTQSIIIALPMLGSKHGMTKSSMAITKASQDFIAAINKRVKSGDATYGIVGHVLDGLEKKAIRDAILAGAIDTTQAADLAGLAENPSAKYNGTYNKAMNIIGWAFHHAEVMNREVTFLAAYRLEFAKTKNHDEAVQNAIRLTNKAHFNYGSLNRARFMQSDVAAVALQFKQYAQNMIYYLVSNLYRGFVASDISKEDKTIARKQLLWTLGITFGIGGLGALPLSGLMMAANAAHGLLGDSDDPFDPETELKKMLSKYFGADIAATLWLGLAPSLSSRISLDGLIWRDINRDEKPIDIYQSALMQLSGPVIGGIGLSIANGVGDLATGSTSRGVEKMVPKALKDVLKAVRYIHEEGVVNKYGSPLIDDVTSLELAQQALGFTPGRLAMRYDQNSAQKEAELFVRNRRSQLMGAYYMGWRAGDSSTIQEVMRKIQKFNRSQWGRSMPIKGVDLQRSIRRRQRNLAESQNGMKVNKKFIALTKDLDYFSN